MADSSVPVTAGSGNNIDTRTEATNSNHRQVVVVGDPAVNANVAAVATQDVGGSDQTTPAALVRLAGSAAVQLVGSTGTVAVHIQSTGGTMAVNVGKTDGTITVRIDPGYELGSLKGINSSVAVHIGSTSGTMAVDVGKVAGSVAVYFSPSNPAVAATFASASLEVVPTTGSRITYDLAHAAQRVLIVGSQAAASLQIIGITNSINVYLGATAGTLGVNVGKISDTVAVFLTGTAGTLGVNVGKISDTVAVYLTATAGTLGVTVGKITDTVSVHVATTGGTLAVKIDPSYNVVNVASTIIIPRTVSSTANGISVSGNTLKSPVASRVIKVYAYSLTTTSAISQVARFTNGAGTGPTEFWRVALQAPSATSTGANFGVEPPGYIFATAAGDTLSMILDGGLVHYSVAYFLETA